MMHEWVHCHNEAANHQLPITVAVFIILHLSTSEVVFLIVWPGWGIYVMDNTFPIKKHS